MSARDKKSWEGASLSGMFLVGEPGISHCLL